MSGSGGPSALSEWGCVKGRTDGPRGSHVVQELGTPRGIIYDEKVLNRHRIIVILGKKTNRQIFRTVVYYLFYGNGPSHAYSFITSFHGTSIVGIIAIRTR